MSGLLIGILFSRSLSGFIANRLSWHTVFWTGCEESWLLLSGVLWIALPSQPPRGHDFLWTLAEIIAATLEVRTHHSTSQRNWRPRVRGLWRLLDDACLFYLHSRPEHLRLRCNWNVRPSSRSLGALVAPLAGQSRGKSQSPPDQPVCS